ncbi:Cathepsin C, partial [Clonorchis sinensis]
MELGNYALEATVVDATQFNVVPRHRRQNPNAARNEQDVGMILQRIVSEYQYLMNLKLAHHWQGGALFAPDHSSVSSSAAAEDCTSNPRCQFRQCNSTETAEQPRMSLNGVYRDSESSMSWDAVKTLGSPFSATGNVVSSITEFKYAAESRLTSEIYLQLATGSALILISKRTMNMIERPQVERTKCTNSGVFVGTLKLTGKPNCPVTFTGVSSTEQTISYHAVTPFLCPTAISPEASTRAEILPGCSSQDRRCREAEVGFEPRTFRVTHTNNEAAKSIKFNLSSVNRRCDTPANCTYEDARGSWSLKVCPHPKNCSAESHDEFIIDLLYPNLAASVKGYGTIGTWTLIYNQGFEITIAHRKWLVMFDFDESGRYFCNRGRHGWSHDSLLRQWWWFEATKLSAPVSSSPAPSEPIESTTFAYSDTPYFVDNSFIQSINEAQHSWKAVRYPHLEKLTFRDLARLTGGDKSRFS